MTSTPAVDPVLELLDSSQVVAAIVSPGGETSDVSRLRSAAPNLTTFRNAGEITNLHDELATYGHFDAIVDLSQGEASRRLSMLMMHLRPRGQLHIAVPHLSADRVSLEKRVNRLLALHAEGVQPPSTERRDRRPKSERDTHALAASVASVRRSKTWITVTNRSCTWNVVPERRFDALLDGANHFGALIHRLPAEELSCRSAFASSEPGDEGISVHSGPPLSLRSYEDAVVGSRMVAVKNDTVLPQTFRNTQHQRPRTPVLNGWTKWAVEVPASLESPEASPALLPGTWLHADSFLPGHFGHALTEQLSQLWSWKAVLEAHPQAGLLVIRESGKLAAWELDLFAAAGVPSDRIFAAASPVRAARLLAATPGYVIFNHIHPGLRTFYDRVGDALEARSELTETPRRVFITRTGQRLCHEDSLLRQEFTRHGFVTISPERHSLADQVAIVRRAEAVAGYGGSGMFHLLMGGAPRPVLAISHTGYHLWNEAAMCSYWGHPLTLIRGTPDLTTESFTQAAMHSDYHVSLADEGRVLQTWLQHL